MQGIAAITANNGWAMAAAGACIVMVGLAILSFVISQLHKFIALFEGKQKHNPAPSAESKTPAADLAAAEIDILNDLPAAARLYRAFTGDLGDNFPLVTLYRIFEKENQPHPHITIMALRNAGYLVPVGEGQFCWKNV